MSERAQIRRGDVVIAEVVSASGRQIRKVRPYLIISPDVLNDLQFTFLVAPLTTGHHPYKYRVPCELGGRRGHIVLDQLYTLDAAQAGPPISHIGPAALRTALATLREMFAE
jgi:mRNA interferase MazF